MKTMHNYLWLMLYLSIGCSSSPSATNTTELTILIDQSDPLRLCPDAGAITAELGLKQNIWQGIRITITTISDKDINQLTVVTIEPESRWTGNTIIRNAKIERFRRELHTALAEAEKPSILGHSIIYRAIAKALNRLAATPSKKKYLLVYSNLVENDEVNFYDRKTLSEVKEHPERIRQQLEKTASIGKVPGIQVWLLYEPASFEENNTYMGIANFYKQLLEPNGAAVHIEHSLNP